MSDFKARISRQAKDVGSFLVIYGPHGAGKTTFAAQAPKSLVVQAVDKSIDVLVKQGVLGETDNLTINDWDDAISFLDWAISEQHGFKTIILDGASGLEKFCDEATLAEDFGGNYERFMTYHKGYDSSALRWADLLNKVDQLKEQGITVMLLAHKGTFEVKNAEGNNYFKWQPAIHEKKLLAVMRYSDAILRMDFKVKVQHVDEKSHKGKALGGGARLLYCTGEPSFEAKNRFNLPNTIDLGDSHEEAWSNFVAARIAGRQKNG